MRKTAPMLAVNFYFGLSSTSAKVQFRQEWLVQTETI